MVFWEKKKVFSYWKKKLIGFTLKTQTLHTDLILFTHIENCKGLFTRTYINDGTLIITINNTLRFNYFPTPRKICRSKLRINFKTCNENFVFSWHYQYFLQVFFNFTNYYTKYILYVVFLTSLREISGPQIPTSFILCMNICYTILPSNNS